MGTAIGVTHDVKNSNANKNGAANELFMTPICVHNRKNVFCYHGMLNNMKK